MSPMNLLLLLVVFCYFDSNGLVGIRNSNAQVPDGSEMNKRIVSGTPAAPGQIPYHVSLRRNGSDICGGAIIDQTHILTAAHCLHEEYAPSRSTEKIPASELSIQYGVTYITDGDQARNLIRVSDYNVIPSFHWNNDTTTIHDVAVVELAEPIVFSDTARSVDLPEIDEETPAGCNAIIAGWGARSPDPGHPPPRDLQMLDVVVYKDEFCYIVDNNKMDPSTKICAGNPATYTLKGTCFGDSGSPLVCNGKVIGLVSRGIEGERGMICGFFPLDIYTKVSTHVPWIMSVVKKSK